MPTEDQAYWDKHIKQFKESGANYKTYCQKEGVHYERFVYRFNKDRNASKVNKLIPVSLKSRAPSVSSLCSIEFQSGHRLFIHDASILDKVLGSLF